MSGFGATESSRSREKAGYTMARNVLFLGPIVIRTYLNTTMRAATWVLLGILLGGA